MLAGELLENANEFAGLQIDAIFTDSRKTTPNSLFVCVKGEKTDGHLYAEEAVKRGAVMVVAERELSLGVPTIIVPDTKIELARLSQKFYGEPWKKLKLIGVTGTNGKTTTTYLIKEVLEKLGKKVGLIGTNRCYIGNRELPYVPSTPTTPSAPELAYIFSEMVKKRVEYVVMEVSSHALKLKRVHGLQFKVGVFTNLTRDHLDFHKTMEEYENSKRMLFDISDVGVVNTDSSAGLRILDKCKCPTMAVGIHDADIIASRIVLGDDYVEFTSIEKDDENRLRLGIPGKFSVYNALCATGALRALGISYEDIKKGFNGVGNVKGRVEKIETNTPFKVFIDYAHTPDGLLNILKTARGFTRKRVIVVFGCGGNRDKTKRSIMGEIAGDEADFTIITSDNPRMENPIEIIEDIKVGIDKTQGEYIIIVNRAEAIEYALNIAREGDTVLLCGKGQETYQIIGNKTMHFDEREIVRSILNKDKN